MIIAGDPVSPDTQQLLSAAHSSWSPDKVIILINPKDQTDVNFWQQYNPEAWNMVENHINKATAAAAAAAVGGGGEGGEGGQAAADGATAFLCQNFTCQAPTSDPKVLKRQLGRG